MTPKEEAKLYIFHTQNCTLDQGGISNEYCSCDKNKRLMNLEDALTRRDKDLAECKECAVAMTNLAESRFEKIASLESENQVLREQNELYNKNYLKLESEIAELKKYPAIACSHDADSLAKIKELESTLQRARNLINNMFTRLTPNGKEFFDQEVKSFLQSLPTEGKL